MEAGDPDADRAVRALADRGIDNPEELLRFSSPEQVFAACRWYDAARARGRRVGPGLLAKRVRDGDFPAQLELDLQSSREFVRVGPWDYRPSEPADDLRNLQMGESVVGHALLERKLWDAYPGCEGNLVVKGGDYHWPLLVCDACGLRVVASVHYIRRWASGVF